MPYEAVIILASSQYPANSQWPVLVKHLSAVLHNRAEQTDVDFLLDHEIFYRLNERSPNDPAHEFKFPLEDYGGATVNFINGLLGMTNGSLSIDWQRRILTTPGAFIDINGMAVEDCVHKLERGIALLKDADELQIADGALKQTITDMLSIALKQEDEDFKSSMKVEKALTKHEMRYLKRV